MPKTATQTVKKVKRVSLKDRYDLLNNRQKHLFIDSMVDGKIASQAKVYRWLQGQDLTYLEQCAVAKYFKVPVEQIFK